MQGLRPEDVIRTFEMFSVGCLPLERGQTCVQSCTHNDQPYWHTCSLVWASRTPLGPQRPCLVPGEIKVLPRRDGASVPPTAKQRGRSTIAPEVFFAPQKPEWSDGSLIDVLRP